MKIEKSRPQPPRSLPRAAPTTADFAAEWQRAADARERERHLAGCPPDLATFAAGVCALVYHPFAIVKLRLDDAGAKEFQPFDRCGSQAIVFARDDCDWIVFRGTQSFPETEMFLDWGHDLLSVPWGWPPLHLGFARAWGKLRELVLDWVGARDQGRGLVIVGHSLGGALALAAANDIARAGTSRIDAVITFGAPRVGTWPWTAKYHRRNAGVAGPGLAAKSLREVTWRIHNSGDIVTYVPLLIFAHCGESVESSFLQAGTAALRVSGFALTPEEVPLSGLLGGLRFGYHTAKRTLPYSPLTLLIDLLFALGETAPQHFMRHYGPAFPDRPFRELGEPRRVGSRTPCDWVLWGFKWLIVISCLVGLFLLCRLLYQMSPELAGALILATVVYSIIGFAFGNIQPAAPTALARFPKSIPGPPRGG